MSHTLTEEERAALRESLFRKLEEERTAKKQIKVISTDEYVALREIASFKCPKNKDIKFCDGKSCPSRPEDANIDYWDECIKARSVLHILDNVLNGGIAVANGNNGWSIPV